MTGILFAFCGAAFLIATAPGPSTIIIVRQAVRRGRRAALLTTLGNEVGVVLWGMLAAIGVSALIVASEVAYLTLRVVGIAVLITLGVQGLRAARRSVALGGEEQAPAAEAVRHRDLQAFRGGLVTVAANPKAAVFAVSFLPQFVPHHGPALPFLMLLSVLWAVIDFVWYTTLITVAGLARHWFTRPAVWRRTEQAAGATLIGLGVTLAAETR